MKPELYYFLTQSIRSKVVCAVSSAAALFLLLAVPFVKSDASKTLLLCGSLATASAAVVTGKTLDEADDALNDYRVTTGLKRQRALLWLPSSSATPKAVKDKIKASVETFDFLSMGDKRDEFPNVFILGAPGTGKTTAAEYLGVVLKAGKRYAVHPHAKPTDFRGFDKIFGGGRNIGLPTDEPVTWEEIESGSVTPTVAQVFLALHKLMQDRYLLYYQGETNFENIDVYFDELPAIASTLGKKFLTGILPSLLMECRKVGIRLWFLSQAFQVRALGLEGISDLREGATLIRLGKLALKEAQTLVNTKAVDENVLEYLRLSDRPVLVDDTPGQLPRFVEMQAAIDSFVNQKKTPTKKTNGRNNRNNSRRKSI
jgi:hypothetical protein